MSQTIHRRTFLKGTLAGSALGVAVSAGLLTPQMALAEWKAEAYRAKTIDDALMQLWGSNTVMDSDKIEINAPPIAENGAVVPVTVESSLPNVTSIAILVEKNPAPLTSSYDFSTRTDAFVKTRIKMGKTSDVVAIVKADGKLYRAKAEVKVTIGGCGG